MKFYCFVLLINEKKITQSQFIIFVNQKKIKVSNDKRYLQNKKKAKQSLNSSKSQSLPRVFLKSSFPLPPFCEHVNPPVTIIMTKIWCIFPPSVHCSNSSRVGKVFPTPKRRIPNSFLGTSLQSRVQLWPCCVKCAADAHVPLWRTLQHGRTWPSAFQVLLVCCRFAYFFRNWIITWDIINYIQ